MDRKNMALILSIFLFVGLLFSVDPLERERDYNYVRHIRFILPVQA